MARSSEAPSRVSTGLFSGPLGCYLRDDERSLADRMTSLLALHRLVGGAAFRDPLWNLSGAEMRRTLLSRLRATVPPSAQT
jgi:hypothetical protein